MDRALRVLSRVTHRLLAYSGPLKHEGFADHGQ